MPQKSTAALQRDNEKSSRPYNERLFIDQIRNHGQMSKAELTRASGLSAQSATVIVNRLVEEGLLQAGDAIKGKIGQPSIPYSLDPDGAYSIGIKIGRRSLEIARMSFDFSITDRIVLRYDFPHLITIQQEIFRCLSEIFDNMSTVERTKFVGIGIALPDELSAWEATVGAPDGAMADWNDADLATELSEKFGLPVSTLNDASAACLSEIAIGNPDKHSCFAYFYVGTFIGGGIAIDHHLYKGQQNLAGAIASIPTGVVPQGIAPQLLEGSSLHYLEETAIKAGLEPDCFYNATGINDDAKRIFDDWLRIAAPQIAFAAISAQAFLDPNAIIIDSSLSPSLTLELIEAVRASIQTQYDHRGLANIQILPGKNGVAARAIGSSIVPFLSEFGLDT